MNEKQGMLARHRGKLISILVVLLSLPVAYYFIIIRNPLPSDEEIIAQFRQHRSDIEELVRRYRNYSTDPKVDHSLWFKAGDTREIMWRARVSRITHSSYRPWLPNPYSVETAKSISDQVKNAKNYELFNKYGGLMVSLLPSQYYRSFSLKYFHIWKELYFIPEMPRIENGELLWPFNVDGEYSVRRRLVKSLNNYPANWKEYECVYRQIEAHWFLSMCNGH